jgi:hypothetical protein
MSLIIVPPLSYISLIIVDYIIPTLKSKNIQHKLHLIFHHNHDILLIVDFSRLSSSAG